jgi:hypothetical protein
MHVLRSHLRNKPVYAALVCTQESLRQLSHGLPDFNTRRDRPRRGVKRPIANLKISQQHFHASASCQTSSNQ